MKTAASID